MNPPPIPSAVAPAYDALPDTLRQVREQVFAVAEGCAVGPLTEALKWGQPSFLTEKSKAGTTIRLGEVDGQPAVFFTCHTHLVDGFRADMPDAFDSLGNRAVILRDGWQPADLDHCLARALTYHRSKKKART